MLRVNEPEPAAANIGQVVEPGMKACPKCTVHCAVALNFCPTCDFKFAIRQPDKNDNTKLNVKKCPKCGANNERNERVCQFCTHDFQDSRIQYEEQEDDQRELPKGKLFLRSIMIMDEFFITYKKK